VFADVPIVRYAGFKGVLMRTLIACGNVTLVQRVTVRVQSRLRLLDNILRRLRGTLITEDGVIV